MAENENEELKQNKLNAIILTALFNLIVIPFVVINFQIEKFHIVFIGFLFLAVINFSYVLFHKFNNFEKWSNSVLISLGLLISYIFFDGGTNDLGILWIYIFPLVAFQLKGFKSGIVFILTFYSIVLIIFILSLFEITVQHHSFNVMITYFLVLFAITGYIYFYDKKRNISENLLRENIEKYEVLFNNLSMGVLMINSEMKIIEANKIAKEWFPNIKNSSNKFCYQCIISEERNNVCPDCAVHLTLTKCLTSSNKLTFSTPKGEKTFQVIANPLFDKNHKITAVIETLEDITEREKDKQMLEQSEEKFRLLANNANDVIWTMNLKGEFTYISPSVERLRGFTVDEVMKQSIFEALTPESAKIAMDVLTKSIELVMQNIKIDKTTLYLEQPCKNGSTVWTELTTTGIYDEDGNFREFLGVTRDITKRKKIEDNLKETSDYLENLITYANAPIIVWDKNLKITRFNQAFEILSGYTYDQIVGEKLEILFPSESVKPSLELIKKTSEGERWVSVEIEILAADGSRKIVLWNSANIYDNEKNVTSTIAQGQDITFRKRAEKELLESKKMLRTVLDAIPARVFWKDKNSVYLGCNLAFARDAGFEDPQDIIGKTDFMLSWENQAQSYQIADQEVINFGINKINFEEIQTNSEGIDNWVRTSKTLLKSFDGEITGILGTYENITKIKVAEEALKESESKLKAFFGSMTEMVVIHKLILNENNEPIDYIITDCNAAFTKITGINGDDVKGKLASEVYQTSPPPYLKEFSIVALSGNPYEFYTYYEAMNKHFLISVVSPSKGEFATITNDITTIKLTEEKIIAKNKELESFLYIASHDLRSPLVNVHGFSNRIQKHTDAIKNLLQENQIQSESYQNISKIVYEDIPKTLAFIISNVAKMDTLINSLLQISRTGRITLSLSQIDMNELIERIVKTQNLQIESTTARIIFDNLPSCYGDYNLINQLFSNLIINALKYRKDDVSPEVNISGKIINKKVLFAIKDNGIGIDAKNLDKIWDVFYRVNPKSNISGEGIGLNLAFKIVEKHHGRIWVESELGIGSTFFVELQNEEFLA